MAATQALKELLAEGVAPDAVVRVGVAVLPPHLKMIDHGVAPGDRFSHLTSAPYQLALAAISPDDAFRLTPGPIVPAVSSFMARIKVRAEEALLSADYPRAWAAHVTVATHSKRYERTVTHVPGDPTRPFGEDELRQKFVRAVAPVLERERAQAMFAAAIAGIERPVELLRKLEEIAEAAALRA
jgi:2-methylcitrate dehydratase PrpD